MWLQLPLFRVDKQPPPHPPGPAEAPILSARQTKPFLDSTIGCFVLQSGLPPLMAAGHKHRGGGDNWGGGSPVHDQEKRGGGAGATVASKQAVGNPSGAPGSS